MINKSYRTIALLSQMGKMVELVMLFHLERKTAIFTHQFGCGKGVSVEKVLYKFYSDYLLDEDELGRTILFDLMKAFDRINPYQVLARWISLGVYDFVTKCQASSGLSWEFLRDPYYRLSYLSSSSTP